MRYAKQRWREYNTTLRKNEMQKFLITPVKDRGKLYWMASFPREGPKGRGGSTGRKQKKFVDREDAEIFLGRVKREYEEKWRWEYWSDTRVRNDVARALGILSKIPGASLEEAAQVYLECRCAQEFRRKADETGEKRSLELSARLSLGLARLATRRGQSLEDLIAGILWAFIERASQKEGFLERNDVA